MRVSKAEEFNDAVQVVRDWLPQAEAELKFRPITEDEEGILQLIENHEVLFIGLFRLLFDNFMKFGHVAFEIM